MLSTLRNAVESSWYRPTLLTLLLIPFSWLFGLVVAARKWAYSIGLFARPELPVPVIVVGNISVGGTGKSPVVAWLVGQLQLAGYTPGVVSRGYGGSSVAGARLVSSSADSAVYGDEPVMLAQMTGCPVCVSRDRVEGVLALAGAGVNVVVADDGLQHYRMRREIEIVVSDGERGFGNGHLLPAGPLRESVRRLQEVDICLVNGGFDGTPGDGIFRLGLLDVVSLDGSESRALTDFSGQQVWGVAGIGNPQRFFRLLRTAGIVVDETSVPDHGRLDIEELLNTRNQPVLMTRKDAVKYAGHSSAQAWFVPIEPLFGAADQEQLLQLVGQRIPRSDVAN